MEHNNKPASKKKTKTNRGGVKVHNNVKLDNDNPLPIYFDNNSFVSIGGHPYLPFFAPDDNHFERFLTIRLLSITQGSCIGDKTLYGAGAGLNVMDQKFPAAFDKKINARRQTIDDILKLAFDAYWQDGNVFIEVVRSEFGGDKFVHLYVHNNLDCRLEEPKDGGDPTHALRSREFRRSGILTTTERAVRIPLWTDMAIDESMIWQRDEKNRNVQRTMLHIKNTLNGIDGYGLPSNFAGINSSMLEYKATRFNLDNFDNNMFLGGLLAIQGNMSQEEEKRLYRNLRKMYTGEGTFGRILPISSETGITDTKFIPFTATHEGHFIELDKRNEEKIILANQWSKELLDMKNQSGLGKGGGYLKELFKIKYKTVIKPAQDLMMFNFIEPLMSIIDEWKGTDFASLPWYIKPIIPISLEGVLDINSLLTVDEGREEIGREELGSDKGKQLISEITKGKREEGPKEEGGENDRS